MPCGLVLISGLVKMRVRFTCACCSRFADFHVCTMRASLLRSRGAAQSRLRDRYGALHQQLSLSFAVTWGRVSIADVTLLGAVPPPKAAAFLPPNSQRTTFLKQGLLLDECTTRSGAPPTSTSRAGSSSPGYAIFAILDPFGTALYFSNARSHYVHCATLSPDAGFGTAAGGPPSVDVTMDFGIR